jgi:hypothetical protein
MGPLTLRYGLRLAVAAAVAQGVLHTFNMLVLDGRVWHLNADEDGNGLSWLGSMTIFTAAVGTLLLAAVVPRRRALLVLAATIALLSLDELLALHERLGQEAREAVGAAAELGRVAWPLLLLPVLATLVWAAVRTLELLAPPERRRLLAGLGVLALAVALEVVWTAFFFVGGEVGDWPDVLQVGVEEGAELAGWILVASALFDAHARVAEAAGP